MHTKLWSQSLEGKRSLGCKWEGSVKMGYEEIGCDVMDWIQLAHTRAQW